MENASNYGECPNDFEGNLRILSGTVNLGSGF